MPEGIMSLAGGPQPPMTAGSPEMFNPAQMSQEEALGIIFQSFDSETISSMRSAREELRGLEPEQLADLSDIIDYMIANPDEYEEIRAQMISEGAATEEDLPPTFDANFLQMFNGIVKSAMMDEQGNIGTPDMGQAQGFAMGGAATLDQMANLGRGGDTMAAHITPGEAFLLRERGGSGTINPVTRQPEFFIGSIGRAISSVGRAVGRAVSSVGRAVGSAVSSVVNFVKDNAPTVLSIGLSFTPLGPIAGAALGAGIGTMVLGGSPTDALRAAAIGGAGGAIFSGIGGMMRGDGFMAGVRGGLPAGMRPDAAAAAAPAQGATPAPTTAGAETFPLQRAAMGAPTPIDPATTAGFTGFESLQGFSSPVQQATLTGQQLAETMQAAGAAPVPGTVPPPTPAMVGTADALAAAGTGAPSPVGIVDRAKSALNFLNPNRAMPTPADVVGSGAYRELVSAGVSPDVAFGQVQQSMTPGMISRFGPLVAAGAGALALTGGFEQQQVPESLGVAPTETGMERFERLYPELAQQNRELAQRVGGYGVSDLQAEAPTMSMFGQPVGAPEVVPGQLPFTPFSQGPRDDLAFPEMFQADALRNVRPLYMAEGGAVDPSFQQLYGQIFGLQANIHDLNQQLNAIPAPDLSGRNALIRARKLRRAQPVLDQKADLRAQIGSAQNDLAALQKRASDMAQRPAAPATPAPPPAQSAAATPEVQTPSMLAPPAPSYVAAPPAQPGFGFDMQPQAALQPVVPTAGFSPAMAGQGSAAFGLLGGQSAPTNGVGFEGFSPLRFDSLPPLMDRAGVEFAQGGVATRNQSGISSMMPATRRLGAINGPGTETSDSIPAYLSDGEFVFTARAVRGAGRGDRSEGIRAMYNLMNNLERMA